jgi:hypothetical protein
MIAPSLDGAMKLLSTNFKGHFLLEGGVFSPTTERDAAA